MLLGFGLEIHKQAQAETSHADVDQSISVPDFHVVAATQKMNVDGRKGYWLRVRLRNQGAPAMNTQLDCLATVTGDYMKPGATTMEEHIYRCLLEGRALTGPSS